MIRLLLVGEGATELCDGFRNIPPNLEDSTSARLIERLLGEVAAKEGKTEEAIKKELLEEKMPTMKFTTAEQIGGLTVFLCSPSADNITGTTQSIDGGWVAE